MDHNGISMGSFAAFYEFFRGASGFALMVSGASLLVFSRSRDIQRQFGLAFLSAGGMFTLSILYGMGFVPFELGNVLLLSGIYGVSLPFFKLVLYLFGGPRDERQARVYTRAALAVVVALFALPWLDNLLGLPPVTVSVEDGAALGPFHFAAAIVMYFLPVSAAVAALALSRWTLSDLAAGLPPLRSMRPGAVVLVLVMVWAAFSLGSGDQTLYRLGQSTLQAFLLAWYLYIMARPGSWREIRDSIEAGHERHRMRKDPALAGDRAVQLGADEVELVTRRLEALRASGTLIQNPELDVGMLAARIGLPAYRLSVFFNTHLKTSFPAWLNRERIGYVCRLMREEPELSVIDLYMSAGYQSKSTFNTQFKKITGRSPSEWRQSPERAVPAPPA
jgi:AraC-like DNA-binding protein